MKMKLFHGHMQRLHKTLNMPILNGSWQKRLHWQCQIDSISEVEETKMHFNLIFYYIPNTKWQRSHLIFELYYNLKSFLLFIWGNILTWMSCRPNFNTINSTMCTYILHNKANEFSKCYFKRLKIHKRRSSDQMVQTWEQSFLHIP